MPIVNIPGVGQVNFPDGMSNQEIQTAIETEILPQFPEVQAQAPRGIVGGAKDLGASFLSGVGNLMQLPGQLGTLTGTSSPERQDVGIQGYGQELEKYAQGLKTPTLRAKEQLLARDVAKADGFFQEAGVQLKGLASDPALLSSFFTEQIPNLVGSFGFGALGKGGAKLLLKNATEEAVSKVGVRSAIAGGAVMQGTDIGYDTYLQIYERLKEEGVPEEEAQGIALAKGRVAALEAAGLSLASTKLPGGASIEKAMLGKGLPGTGGFLKSTLGEAVSEALEEGGGKFASNIGIQEVFPETELLKGVGAATAMGGLGGALFGAPAGIALGARARREAELARQLEERNRPVEEVEDTGLAGTREVYADEADRQRVEAFRALQARKDSDAFKKLDELNQQVKAKQAEIDARKAAGSAFATAEFDEQGNVITPRQKPTGLLPYDPMAGKTPYFVFPDGSVATSKEAAFAAKYAPQLSTEGVNEMLGRFNAMPDIPEVSSENITRFGFIPEGGNTVQVTEGEKVTRKDGSEWLKYYDENGKAAFRKMDKVLVDPTEDDIINLEYDNAFKTIELGTNDFANWLTKQGVKADQMADVIGDSKKSKNKKIGTGKDRRDLFREDGQQLDELATRARDAGFMTQADIDADGDVGGVRKLTDMINEAWNGNIVVTPKMQDAFAEIEQLENMFRQRREQVQQQPQATEADLAPLEGVDLEADILAQAQAIPEEQFVPEGAPIAQEISAETAPAEIAYKQAVEQGIIPEAKAEARLPQDYYTDKFLAEARELAVTLRNSLDKMGLKGIGLNLEDTMYRLIDGRMSEVNGSYFDKLINLSLAGPNIFRTMNHEAVHAMKDLGFFSDRDWALLSDLAKSQWIKKYDPDGSRYGSKPMDIRIEEAIADAFADMQTQPPAIKSYFNQIINVLKRIGNVLRGKGFRTAQDIFREAAEGKLSEQVETAKQWNELLEIKPIKQPLSDAEIQGKKFADNIEAKKFANRQLPDGTEVMVRLNLNGTIERPDGTKMHLVTVHEPFSKKKDGTYNVKVEKAIGYDGVVTIRDVDFIVNQRARANIVSGKEAKSPMGGAQGKIVQTVPNLEGVRITFNPLREHVFVRVDDGRPIKRAEEMTVSDTDAVVRGKIDYYTAQDMPKPLDNEPTAANFNGVSPMDVTINRKPIQKKGAPKKEELFDVSGVRKTDTPAFRNWFGNSKVVDENGAPRVMYHGTASDITKFYPNQFFTFSPKAATTYALKEQYEQDTRFDGESDEIQGANILPVYIKAENIAQYEDVMDTAKKLGLYDEDKDSSYQYTSSYTDEGIADAVIADLKKQGFDSIYHHDYDLEMNRIVSLQVFNPVNIKSVNNVGTFSQADEAIRYEVPTPKQLKSTMDGVNPDVAQRIISQFTKTPLTVKQKFDSLRPNMAERLIQGLFDEFRSIKKYSEEAYMKAILSKSTDGALEGLLYYGQVELKDGALIYKKGTKGLLDILEPLGTEVDRYQIWKALNRDARLPADKRSFKDLIGDRDELINGQINGVPRKQVYEKALKEENELNRSVLDIAKAQGLIDDAAYERFSNDIYYIPFYSEMEDGDVGSINASSKLTNQYFSKKLKGGERKTNDLMENVLMNWSHILSASMKNAAAVSTLKSAVSMDAAQKVKQTTVKGAAQYYFMENGERVFVDKKDVVKVMEGGNESAYIVKDGLLMDSISLISSLGPKFPGLDIAKGFTDALRYGVTLSPAYKIRNLIRDAVQSAAVSRVGLNVFDNVAKGLALSSRDNPTFIDALIGGGVFEMGVAHEGDQAKMIKRLIKKGVAQGTILDTPEKVKDALGKALDWYNEQGNRFENANRLTLFKKLTDEGKSHLEASFAARDLMNFSSQGSFRAIKVVSQLVPFFNARLQGLYKLGRDGITPTYRLIYNTTTGKPIEASDKIKAQSFMAVSSAVMLASALLYLSFKDDEDFKRRENWDRDNFWWFKIGDTQFRIPKPFEIGALGTIMERTLEQVVDEKVEGKVLADRMQNILWETFSLNPIPQAAKPLIDLYADKDSFTGAPIESESLKRLSKQERYTESTTALAKVLASISQGTAQVLSLNKNAEGLSPVQVDFALKAYFGWAGSTAAAVSDKAVQPWSDVEKPGKPLIDTVGMGFIKTMPQTQSKYVTSFYENNQRINQAFADMKRYAETGQMEKVTEILQEKGDLIALQKVYDKTSKQLAEYRKYIQTISRDPKMSKADKEAEIARAKIVMSEMTRLAEETRISLKK
jgi:hypothetical protein